MLLGWLLIHRSGRCRCGCAGRCSQCDAIESGIDLRDRGHDSVGHGVECFGVVSICITEILEGSVVFLLRCFVRHFIFDVAGVSCLCCSGTSGAIPDVDLGDEEELEVVE